MNTQERYALLTVVLIAIVGSIWYLQKDTVSHIGNTGEMILAGEQSTSMSATDKATQYPRAREIVNPSGFINSPIPDGTGQAPFTLSEFIGKKVILVDIWTYSCINCQRTLPYITAWHDKYEDDGLLIVGIHTPEFEFEKVYENVQKAVKQFGIEYPVVLDNDYGTWNNYNNRYWPRKYLIDIDGYIVDDHIGEGGYEETERKIQELLQERAQRLGEESSVETSTVAVSATTDPNKPRTPEIYFGAWRNELWGNGTAKKVGATPTELPKVLLPNYFYLQGNWNIESEFAQANSAGDTIMLRYSGANVYMVAQSDMPTVVEVRIDGKLVPQTMRGTSVGADGTFTVHESKLYHIMSDQNGWGEHTIELIIKTPGLEAFTFTFG